MGTEGGREREKERTHSQPASGRADVYLSLSVCCRHAAFASGTSTSRVAVVEMHDFHWRNSRCLRLRARSTRNRQPDEYIRGVSRSPEERVYVRSSESLSCSLHFSVTLICGGHSFSLFLLVFLRLVFQSMIVSLALIGRPSFTRCPFLFLLSRFLFGTYATSARITRFIYIISRMCISTDA